MFCWSTASQSSERLEPLRSCGSDSILQHFENRLKEAQSQERNFGIILATETNGLDSKQLKSLLGMAKMAGKDRQERKAAMLSSGKMNLFLSDIETGTVGVHRHKFSERDLRLEGFESGIAVVGIKVKVGDDSGNGIYVCGAAVLLLSAVILNKVEKIEHIFIHRES